MNLLTLLETFCVTMDLYRFSISSVFLAVFASLFTIPFFRRIMNLYTTYTKTKKAVRPITLYWMNIK